MLHICCLTFLTNYNKGYKLRVTIKWKKRLKWIISWYNELYFFLYNITTSFLENQTQIDGFRMLFDVPQRVEQCERFCLKNLLSQCLWSKSTKTAGLIFMFFYLFGGYENRLKCVLNTASLLWLRLKKRNYFCHLASKNIYNNKFSPSNHHII